jgi:hypothetical protein
MSKFNFFTGYKNFTNEFLKTYFSISLFVNHFTFI